MRTLFVFVIGIIIVLPAFGAPPEYRHHALVEVFLDSPAQIRALNSLHLDIVPGETQWTPRVIALPEDLTKLSRAGFSYRTIHADMEEYYAGRARSAGHLDDMGGYHTFSEIALAMDSMHANYPAITTAKFSVGTSIEGRTLWCLKISDNPGVDEAEPELYYNALIHAREPAGMEAVLFFMNYLLEHYGTDPVATSLVDSCEFFFIPCINPDGYEYNRQIEPSGGGMWRKNRRNNGDGSYGVDLNRNWGLTWGFDNEGSSPWPSDETYRGTAPFSEPETAALRDFINARDFSGSLDYHTYSNYVLFPWGTDVYEGNGLCHDDFQFRVIADSMQDAIWHVNGAGYKTGTVWEVLYNSNGGSFEWEYGDTALHAKMFSLTTEVGNSTDEFWPTPGRIAPLCAENLAANLFYARYVSTIRRDPDILVSPAALSVALGINEVAERQVFVTNQGARNLEYSIRFESGTVVAETGGPDSYGYRWEDSFEPCGPVFQWLPLSSAGTQLTFGATDGDAVRGPFPLGFSFRYYGYDYDRIWISANGWISFTDSLFTASSNRYLPTISAPAASICAWWDDLRPNLTGTNIRFWTNGVDSAAAHFENVRAGTAPNQGTYNFQILLTARGDVTIFYGDMGTLRLNSATVGIQDHMRTRGMTILWNVAGVGNNVARRFAFGPRWAAAAPTAGSVPPGATDTLTVLVDGSLLCGDSASASFIIRSTDPDNTNTIVPLFASHDVLLAPAHLTAIFVPDGVRLRWSSSEHAAGYWVERADTWNSPFELLAQTTDTVFTDTTAFLLDGPLFYQVRAVSQIVPPLLNARIAR